MILLVLLLASFSRAEIVPDVIISTESIAERRIYRPLKQRDPMVRTSVTSPTTLNYSYTVSTSTREIGFDMERVVLEGIMSTASFKEALLRDILTGEMYIVRYGRIYTTSRKIIEGYYANIIGKAVVIGEKKTGRKKELVMSE